MFSKNYYCLVAGLREWTLDADTKGFDAKAIVDDILEELSSDDARAVRLLHTGYDCQNIIARREGRTYHNPLGNLSAEQIDEILGGKYDLLPRSLAEVMAAYADPEGEHAEEVDVDARFEKSLFEAYYSELASSKCRFLREWGAFDRNLRNIAAAVAARVVSRPIDSVVVGSGDVVEQLVRSSAADFGLRGELPYIDSVITAIADESNLVEKEHKIDLIRWNQAEELTVFDYFNINTILSYIVKVDIVARWSVLNPEKGRQMLDRLMRELDAKELVNKQ